MKRNTGTYFGILAAILVLALTSMACGFSIGTPRVDSNIPFLATATTRASSGNVLPTPVTKNDSPPVIPGGAGNTTVGNLAGPVTNAPANLEDLYVQTNPGVVSILVQVTQNGQAGEGAGSGFVLTDQGHIVTNHHVIDGATTIVVRFYNGADSKAKVVGDDPNSDLAIIQVEKMAAGAKPLPMGDSSAARVGDSVVAIGNPLALGTSMSSGIVSALGRTIPSGFTPYNIPEAIQTDAAINPGNSGGPLLNMNGEVIGINAQIRTTGQGGGNIGIGFAIPINILKQIYASLITTGSYTWPFLGVGAPAQQVLAVTTNDTEAQQGAYIAEVQSGGPADQAGMQKGDVVTQIDGKQIISFDDLLTYIAYKHPGDKVNMTVMRSGQAEQLTVTLGERPVQQSPNQ